MNKNLTRKLSTFLTVLLGLIFISGTTPSTTSPTVFVVGNGMMGANHIKILGDHVVAVADTNPERLKNLQVPTFSSIEEGLKTIKADVIDICSNTKYHAELIQLVFEVYGPNPPALFVEKPIVGSLKEADVIFPLLCEHGYGQKRPFGCGYLFRSSPAVKKLVEIIEQNKTSGQTLILKEVDCTWQKDREKKGPPRPTQGVHHDEATHGADLVNNLILPAFGVDTSKIVINRTIVQKESAFDKKIAPGNLQEELAKEDPSLKDPVAKVEYDCTVSNVKVHGMDSFVDDPQKREITLTCSDNIKILLKFDVNNSDIIEMFYGDKLVFSEIYNNVNKLALEMDSFFSYYTTQKRPIEMPSLEDLYFNVQFTEALGQNVNEPITLERRDFTS